MWYLMPTPHDENASSFKRLILEGANAPGSSALRPECLSRSEYVSQLLQSHKVTPKQQGGFWEH